MSDKKLSEMSESELEEKVDKIYSNLNPKTRSDNYQLHREELFKKRQENEIKKQTELQKIQTKNNEIFTRLYSYVALFIIGSLVVNLIEVFLKSKKIIDWNYPNLYVFLLINATIASVLGVLVFMQKIRSTEEIQDSE